MRVSPDLSWIHGNRRDSQDDTGHPARQKLTFYVDGMQRLQTTSVDDTWQGGGAGLYRTTSSTTTTRGSWTCGRDAHATLKGSGVTSKQLTAAATSQRPGT